MRFGGVNYDPVLLFRGLPCDILDIFVLFFLARVRCVSLASLHRLFDANFFISAASGDKCINSLDTSHYMDYFHLCIILTS